MLQADHAAVLAQLADRDGAARCRLEAELGARSFKRFVRMAWPYFDPAHLMWNWHADLICDEMERAVRREVRDLVISIPPRCMKSSIVGVALNAWVWTWAPQLKFITAAYEMRLATRDAERTRDLVKTPWYQARWGPLAPWRPPSNPGGTAISLNQDNKTFYETTAKGYRFVTTPGANVTGWGSDIILCLPGDQTVLTDLGRQRIDAVVEAGLARTVLAYDHATGEAAMRPILAFERHPPRELVEIETADGHVLRCTLDHPVWVEGRGYIPAADVRPDDVVITCPASSSG